MDEQQLLALKPELDRFLDRFAPLFGVEHNQLHARSFLQGLLRQGERRNSENIAEAIAGCNVRNVQAFITTGAWQDSAVLAQMRGCVLEVLADDDAVCNYDETGFPKKGTKSVGVKRQYSGTLGRTDNCQIGVFANYCSTKGHTFMDRRLFLPQEWAEDKTRREEAGVPEEVVFRTKPELALEMLTVAVNEGVRFRWVGGDSAYGDSPTFVQGVRQLGKWYMVDTSADARVWTEQPQVIPAEQRPKPKRGRPYTQPLVVGDLRALADQFADALAPDLSNRVRDGRWVTILAWCLARSQEVFHASGGRSVATRAQQRERYAWLRPLELMWVARTIALAEDWQNRPLSGQRRVRPWYEYGHPSTDRLGMTEDQFRAYRQTGMYGGYRVAFRRWPGMTEHGDGWTPGKATRELAKWLDARLGAARPPWPLHADDGDEGSFPSPNKRSLGKEHEWWLRQWKTFDVAGRSADQNTLPRRRDDFTILPESDQLKPLLFGDDLNGKRRLDVAREVENASALSHLKVCEHLGRTFASDPTFVLLPRFSRLADAGMVAMDLLARSLQNNSRVELADVASCPDAEQICDELWAAAQEWLKNAQMQLRHVGTAHSFAGAIPSARPMECLGALLRHHEDHGGGLRWFVLRNGRVEPRTPWRPGSSLYRFRLWSLCRLATQCGVLVNMPRALLENVEFQDVEAEEDETLETAND